MTIKLEYPCFPISFFRLLAVLCCGLVVFLGSVRLSADDQADGSDELKSSLKESDDPDNPGMPWLDEATEEKLLAGGEKEFGRVIALCKRAKKAGLMGENLDYCNQLLAATQLQRGLLIGARILDAKDPAALPRGWEIARTRVLADLEEAVSIIKDQPRAYLAIAQLNMLPGGDKDRAREAVEEAERSAKGDPGQYAGVITYKASLADSPEEQEKIIAAATKDNPDAQLMLLHSLSLLNLKRFDGALDVLHKVLEDNPKNTIALNTAYEILVQTEHFDEALPILDKLEEALREEGTEPARLQVLREQRLRLLTALKRFDDALKLLDDFPDDSPQAKTVRFSLRTLLYLDMEEYDKAVATNDEAQKYLDALPENTPGRQQLKDEVFRQRLNVFVRAKRFDDAVKMLEASVKESPENAQHYFLLIAVLSEQEEFAKAMEVVDKALEQFADSTLRIEVLRAQKVRILLAMKKPDDAMKIVDEILRDDPDNADTLLLKMQVFIEKESYDKALEILEGLIAQNPDNSPLKLMQVQILATQKKNRKALEMLEPLIEEDPENIPMLRIKSQILISLNRHSEAIKTLEKVIREEPEDEVSINNLSWLLSTSPIDLLRNGDRALELALKACELSDYKKAYILSTLAAAYAETGNFEKALEWSQKSLDMAGEDENVKDRIDDLKKELDSYKLNKPYREDFIEDEEE